MGRAWRIEFDGAFYHVMSRRNEDRNIFFDDNDRYGFLGFVGEISEAVQWLGVTYTRRFNNNKHSRIGHLFQGRFISIIVQMTST
jgi:hypothetical protein